ncbi:hypothetical protein SARC_04571 [Sphaeroforma arctica JP610]|uniref:Uncharacterized protein n=1 Tax=Sphaeroforma arctica JP610 TaxID=667725 RepID=A0A0L0G269_9EUKA|nr:hypothetical protein SARC_04571 [Sphaeroforma arctica JP610]KNC83165.1 hypothetical protein SARC_04571 [Sphaeroforma arctica JP610]|eukprot:XP_014157067.1 hypothetical protein SARC_04571 [Sphaeroforma arctica JP610]
MWFRSRAIEEAADRGYVDILDALQQTAAGQPLLAQAHTNETISERALEYASECLQRCYNGIPRWRDVGPMCLRFVTRQVQRDVNTALSRLGWVIVLCALSFLLPQSVLDMAKVFIPARALAAWESLRR